MTSRTIVSPNSKIEWISSVSSRSMEPSSLPSSAIVRKSASDTNGPVRQALARQEDVGQTDQRARGQGEHAPEEPDERRDGERGTVGVQHAERLARRLDQDEVQQREADRHERDAEPAVGPLRDDRDEDRGPVLAEHHREVDRVEVPGRVGLDPIEQDRVAPALLDERERPNPRHPRQRSLRDGEHRADHHEDRDEDPEPVHARSSPALSV